MALMPLCTIRKRTSCRRGSAVVPFSGLPSGSVGPVQKILKYQLTSEECQEAQDAYMRQTSADAAALGQIIESIFSGPDCSVHKSCWPVMRWYQELQHWSIRALMKYAYHQEQGRFEPPSGLQEDQRYKPVSFGEKNTDRTIP